jgi:hypothetical protein
MASNWTSSLSIYYLSSQLLPKIYWCLSSTPSLIVLVLKIYAICLFSIILVRFQDVMKLNMFNYMFNHIYF